MKFYKEFIFVIIQRINMQISTFYHLCHQKREFDVILIYSMWMVYFTTGAFQVPSSRKYNHTQSRVIHQNDKMWQNVTKCWNLHVDAFDNNKYKFLVKLHYVFSLMQFGTHYDQARLRRYKLFIQLKLPITLQQDVFRS